MKRLTREEVIDKAIVEMIGFAEHAVYVTNLYKREGVAPMIGIAHYRPDNHRKPMEVTVSHVSMEDDDAKNRVARILRDAWKHPDVEVTMHLSEAWELSGEGKDVEEYLESGKDVSESPDRKEIFMVNLSTRDRHMTVCWDLNHVDGKIVLSNKVTRTFDKNGMALDGSGAYSEGRFMSNADAPTDASKLN